MSDGGHRRRADTQAGHLRAMPAPLKFEATAEHGQPRPRKDWRYWLRHPREWRDYRRLLKRIDEAGARLAREQSK